MVFIIEKEGTSSPRENESQPDPLELSSPKGDRMEDLGPAFPQFEEGSQGTLDELLKTFWVWKISHVRYSKVEYVP